MSASNPNSDVFYHDAGRTQHWRRLDPSHDPRLFAYPDKIMPDRRQVWPLLVWHRQQLVERITTYLSDVCCQLPSQWLN